VHTEDRAVVFSEWSALTREGREYAREFRFVNSGDEVRHVHVRSAPIFSEAGELIGHAGTVEDIAERREFEAQLRRSEEWLKAIFDASRDGILVEDDERIVYVNKAYTALLGYERPEELKGRHVSEVVASEDRERLLEFGRSRVRGEATPSIYEFKGGRRDATVIDLEASVSTSTVEGKPYIITSIRDIAERKRAGEELRRAHDELERRVAARTTQLAQANEVLRAEVVERKQAEKSRDELIRRLVTAQEEERRRISRELHDEMGQHLAALMLGLKSLGQESRGRQATLDCLRQLTELAMQIDREVDRLALELRPTALDDLGLRAALANYAEAWSERSRIPVDFHCAGLDEGRHDLPPHIETVLYRIAQESLTNVLKHARARRVSLIIERRYDHALAIIEDDGCGFETEESPRAAHAEHKLGLLGMGERVTLAGGTFNVESVPGVGTTVFVRVPVPPASGNAGGGLRRGGEPS
ncbi:MAG: PAS domain S-box protein, partial [Pyrinomonadaceae bacterium]